LEPSPAIFSFVSELAWPAALWLVAVPVADFRELIEIGRRQLKRLRKQGCVNFASGGRHAANADDRAGNGSARGNVG